MAQDRIVPPETGKQAVKIRIKMKWHKIKECHLKQGIKLPIRIKMKWHKIKEPSETGKQAVSIRIKLKWHKIKECHGNPFIMLAVLQTLS